MNIIFILNEIHNNFNINYVLITLEYNNCSSCTKLGPKILPFDFNFDLLAAFSN